MAQDTYERWFNFYFDFEGHTEDEAHSFALLRVAEEANRARQRQEAEARRIWLAENTAD